MITKSTNPRVITSVGLKKGIIKRSPVCELCGVETKTIGHHKDYSKPLDIQWLCNPCHKQLHAQIKIPNAPEHIISITPETKARLDKIGDKGDTYEDIIRRLLDERKSAIKAG